MLLWVAVAMIFGTARAQKPAPVQDVSTLPHRTPDDERKALHVPPGFEIQLVAAEPDIQKPLNLAFDDRGRLWVTDTVEYPYPAQGGNQAARYGEDPLRVRPRWKGPLDPDLCRWPEHPDRLAPPALRNRGPGT